MQAEWRTAPEFAEFAEALRCRTNQIMAVAPQEGGYMVFFTPFGDGVEAEVYAAVLRRDRDGIIRQAGTSFHQPGFIQKLKEAMG